MILREQTPIQKGLKKMTSNVLDIAEILVHFSEFPNRIEFIEEHAYEYGSNETIRVFDIYVDGKFVSKNFSDCMDFSRHYHIKFYRYDLSDYDTLKLWVVKK